MQKKWQVLPETNQTVVDKYPELNPVILQLLFNRGLTTQDQIDDFFAASYEDQIHDPFLFQDMSKAVKRLFEAVFKKEKVMIFGDYDADGVSASAIMYQALTGLGLSTEVYIPFRETEGYSLNQSVAENIVKQGFNLVVTVDCGISNHREIAYLNQHGIDTIITDHHQEPAQLPSAYAILNPALKNSGYPFRYLCGAGVAFKVVQAIMIYQAQENMPIQLPAGFDKWLLDLVAIATIGDICPLTAENRVLVKYGLVVLAKTKRVGLQHMFEVVNNFKGQIDTQYVGWRVVPRLNAAGRIDHASASFKLLTSQDETEVIKLMEVLENNNKKRQQITDSILKQSLDQIGEVTDADKLLVAVGQDWPAGVVGLVAGRLADKHQRPTLIISRDQEQFVGSGRSIEQFNITEALGQCHDLLVRYGGHSQACGFSLQGQSNYDQFIRKMKQLAHKALKGVELIPTLRIDAVMQLAQADWDLQQDLGRFEPFGEGNPTPLFLSQDLVVEQIQALGADNKHLRLQVSQEGTQRKLIGFGFGDWCDTLKLGEKIDVVYELSVNEWNGNRELQLKIIDLKQHA